MEDENLEEVLLKMISFGLLKMLVFHLITPIGLMVFKELAVPEIPQQPMALPICLLTLMLEAQIIKEQLAM